MSGQNPNSDRLLRPWLKKDSLTAEHLNELVHAINRAVIGDSPASSAARTAEETGMNPNSRGLIRPWSKGDSITAERLNEMAQGVQRPNTGFRPPTPSVAGPFSIAREPVIDSFTPLTGTINTAGIISFLLLGKNFANNGLDYGMAAYQAPDTATSNFKSVGIYFAISTLGGDRVLFSLSGVNNISSTRAYAISLHSTNRGGVFYGAPQPYIVS